MAEVHPPYRLDSGSQGHHMTPDDGHCPLFQFIVDALITGFICLFGFAGNTASFMTLWREKVCVTTFLLQAIIIADFSVLWMLFIGDSVPGLAYIIPILQGCHTTCRYVSMVTTPLLFLAQSCGVWLTLLALVDRYILMCKPSRAGEYCTLETAKKHVIIIILVAVVTTLPQTFSHGVFVREHVTLADTVMYRLVYDDVLTVVCVYALPLAAQVYFLTRLVRVVRSVHRLRRTLAASYRMQHVDLTQLLLTVTVTMVICYTPTVVTRCFLWASGHPHERCGTLVYYLDSFSKVFLALNSSIKVILLCLFVKDFHRKLRRGMMCSGNVKPAVPPPPPPPTASESAYSMYKCADMSEMTLISNVDSRV